MKCLLGINLRESSDLVSGTQGSQDCYQCYQCYQ